MSPTVEALLRSWPLDPWLIAFLLGSSGIYLRGWLVLRRRDRSRWSGWRLAAFLGGQLTLFLALASPIESLGSLLLQAHMLQHLLLMMVAPPLIWLGAPFFPVVRGLPRPIRTFWLAPILQSRPVRDLIRSVTQPIPALAISLLANWCWHVPDLYEAALRSSTLHRLQHLCFLGASLLFWYPVTRPYPARPRWSAWLLLPYLLIADLSNTLLSALLTFSDRVLYPHYAQIPRLWGISALADQSAAGVLMWVPGSAGFLVPLFAIGTRLLFGGNEPPRAAVRPLASSGLIVLTNSCERSSAGRFDLLEIPLVGPFLRWRHARLSMQMVTSGLAALVVADGLLGTRVAALNLAGILPWIHWRGFLILGLLVAGNISCMACPFLVPRTIARRWLPAGLRWPRRLRSKWLAVALVSLFFWAYEAFALWDNPRATAGIVIGYFLVALVIDGLFREASFCKYLCPIGQFNFVQSLVSPLELQVKHLDACQACATKDCIRGNSTGQNGCELGLYLPRKVGNLDCTFCLDCVHACAHDNVGIVAVPPGANLGGAARQSGIGRLSERPDIAALVLVLVAAAFANASGMTEPLQDWKGEISSTLGLSSLTIVTLFYVLALIVAPGVVFGLAAGVGGGTGEGEVNRWRTASRFAHALIPIGFAMWLAHYSFHLLTSFWTIIPATQRFAATLGWGFLDSPEWSDACCRPVAEWLPRLEIVGLDLGLLLSLYHGARIARETSPTAWRAFAPWAVVILILFALGVWVVLQRMQMRGTLSGMSG